MLVTRPPVTSIPLTPGTLTAAAAFGLIMGSAVTAMAYRVPREISWFHGRSKCPHCEHSLAVQDLLPLVSWLSTLGRCRYCRARVAWRYPLTEIACAAWSVLLALKVGLGPTYPLLALWGYLMIALLWIDLDYQ